MLVGGILALAAFSLFYYVYAATTISTNISTGGTLAVTGVSTLTGELRATSTALITGNVTHYGNTTLGDAYTDLLSVVGNASTTQSMTVGLNFYVTGASVLNGNVTLGDAYTDTLTVNANASTTRALTVGGDFYVNGFATTTYSTGLFETQGGLTVAGASVLNGNVTLGNAYTDTLSVVANASTTQSLTVGVDHYVAGRATTTGSSGDITTQGDITLLGRNLVVTTSNTSTSTIEVGCMQMYPTSTVTAVRLEFHASSTLADSTNGATDGLVVWKYGSCPI